MRRTTVRRTKRKILKGGGTTVRNIYESDEPITGLVIDADGNIVVSGTDLKTTTIRKVINDGADIEVIAEVKPMMGGMKKGVSKPDLLKALELQEAIQAKLVELDPGQSKKATPKAAPTLVPTASAPAGRRAIGALAIDSEGNMYLADTNNNKIQLITPDGTVSSIANIESPNSIAIDSDNNLYVANDSGIVKLIFDGSEWRSVQYVGRELNPPPMGGQRGTGYADGVGGAAMFNGIRGMAFNTNGILYVADSGNKCIRKITSNGKVSTLMLGFRLGLDPRLARQRGGSALRPPIKLSFSAPSGITIDSNNKMYIADNTDNTITSLTLGTHALDRTNVTINDKFTNLGSIAVNSSGDVYVDDNNIIRKLTFTNNTTKGGRRTRKR